MPLRTTDSVEPLSLKSVAEQYLIFYSSITDTNGKMWCPDCIAVDDTVQQIFGPSGPSALIVYVGQKAEWKTPNNPLRGEPWKVQSVPTIIKLDNSQEVSRLVDSEINRSLKSFISE